MEPCSEIRLHLDIPKFTHITQGEGLMLNWSLTFFIIALIAAFLGFGGIAAGAASIAKVLFFVFLALFIFSLITRRRRV